MLLSCLFFIAIRARPAIIRATFSTGTSRRGREDLIFRDRFARFICGHGRPCLLFPSVPPCSAASRTRSGTVVAARSVPGPSFLLLLEERTRYGRFFRWSRTVGDASSCNVEPNGPLADFGLSSRPSSPGFFPAPLSSAPPPMPAPAAFARPCSALICRTRRARSRFRFPCRRAYPCAGLCPPDHHRSGQSRRHDAARLRWYSAHRIERARQRASLPVASSWPRGAAAAS